MEKKQEQPPITIDSVLDYYEGEGVIGEESLCILQTLAAIHKMKFGILSSSGSGKSFLVNKMINLLPEVYTVGQGSEKAMLYDKELQTAKILYFPELQKTLQKSKFATEILKSLGEDQPATYQITQGKRTTSYTIPPDKGIIFTLAEENSYKLDSELSRRFLLLRTDGGEDLTDKILEKKADSRKKKQKQNSKPLQYHIKACLHLKATFENPYIDEIAQDIPRTLLARSYADHFFDLCEASTRFHFKERQHHGKVYETTREDVELVAGCYWNTFIETLGEDPKDYPTSFS